MVYFKEVCEVMVWT